jgi:hypothetical protein
MRLRFGIALLSCTLAVAAACSSADPAPASDGNEGTSAAGLSETRQGDLGINPCAAVLCPTDTSCEVVDGEASCVPFATSCAVVLCLEGTECIESDGRAECVPQGPTSCAAVTCLAGDECVESDGRAECVPQGPTSCAAVTCLVGDECIERDGRAECVPSAASCAAVLCLEGTVCEERDGRAQCVPFENPCNLTDCATGLICELQGGEAVCVPPPGGITCASVLCIVGTVCEETPTGPQCLPSGDFCGGFAGIPCGSGEECVDDPSDDCDPQNGGADCGGVCIPEAPKQFCGGIAAFECPGAGVCVDDPADDCDPENGGADCGGVCECSGVLALCLPGTVFDNDPSVCGCVEQPVTDPCAAVRCRAGFHCEADDGVAECVSDRTCNH